VAPEFLKGNLCIEPGKSTLMATRKEVERGWRATSDILLSQGQPELAAQVRRFANQMSPPQTEKERLAAELLDRKDKLRIPDQHPVR
jgi:hypothetical protein